MLTLKQLQKLASEVDSLDGKAAACKRLSDRLAAIRNGEKPLIGAYKALCSWEAEVQSAIEGVINELGPDLLRIAEMRNDAAARRFKVEAAAKRSALGEWVANEKSAS